MLHAIHADTLIITASYMYDRTLHVSSTSMSFACGGAAAETLPLLGGAAAAAAAAGVETSSCTSAGAGAAGFGSGFGCSASMA